jgi:hypothetical protein
MYFNSYLVWKYDLNFNLKMLFEKNKCMNIEKMLLKEYSSLLFND